MSPKICHVIWPNDETQRVTDFISSGSKKRRSLNPGGAGNTSAAKLVRGSLSGSQGILAGNANILQEYSALSTNQLGTQSQLLGSSENELKAYAALPINANVGGKIR
ncbi:hypothetical protein HDU76_001004 [Blyttiomyces sp. JEL0837]|nr:hypothetical protein HDU76_001004 [Blyttiomyces sp. JEL0837]